MTAALCASAEVRVISWSNAGLNFGPWCKWVDHWATYVIQTSKTFFFVYMHLSYYLGRVKRIWYLSPMRAVKVQASLRIRAVSPEPPLLAHTSSESWGTLRQKARSLAPLNGWACAVKIWHEGMLEDTNSLDLAHLWKISAKYIWNTKHSIRASKSVEAFESSVCGNEISSSKSHLEA